jgi:hypothetical protein
MVALVNPAELDIVVVMVKQIQYLLKVEVKESI